MKKSFLLTAASALVALPLAVSAETINLYGWQNHSWEFVDIENGPEFDRIQGNAANIGFAASVDTGMNGIHVNLQCEQFTYVNHFAGGTGWCNRNSKIGLAHSSLGEIMFATWLLPYNEAVAQWVDPFYDAGADSHTSIMGSVGANTIFYNTGQFEGFSTDRNGGIEFNYTAVDFDQGFNRRQEHIIQYWSPNVNGFVFRYAQTAGSRDETGPTGDLDPVIRSTSLAYENGPFWAAVTYQEHEDWAAAGLGGMDSSDAESYRFAARYIMDLGDGMSIQISAMYEDLEYEFQGATGSSTSTPERTVRLTVNDDDGNPILDNGGNPMHIQEVARHEITGDPVLVRTSTGGTTTIPLYEPDLERETTTVGGPGPDAGDLTFEVVDTPLLMRDRQARDDEDMLVYDDEGNPVFVRRLDDQGMPESDDEGNPLFEQEPVPVYQTRTIAEMPHDTGIADAMAAFGYSNFVSPTNMGAYAAAARDLGNGNITFEREAFLISGKVKFGGPLDFRFSYMDADDLEISCAACVNGEWDETAADAWNVGLYYTMPAGTELRLTYSEVSNDAQGTYGQGISGTGLGTPGGEVEMIAIGIVHWFD